MLKLPLTTVLNEKLDEQNYYLVQKPIPCIIYNNIGKYIYVHAYLFSLYFRFWMSVPQPNIQTFYFHYPIFFYIPITSSKYSPKNKDPRNFRLSLRICFLLDNVCTYAEFISSFVFRHFWRRSYQNQLSFSGKDSTADFLVFCHLRKTKMG